MDESNSRPTLDRSESFDHSVWQRPPSQFSIKVNRESIRRQNTFPGTNVDEIVEEGNNISTLSSNDINMTLDTTDSNISSNNSETSEVTSVQSDISPIDVLPSFSHSLMDRSASEQISEMGGFIECVKAISVFSGDEIDEGDHIVFAGAVYDHHGIVVYKSPTNQEFEIIEATNTISGVAIGLSKLFGGKARLDSTKKEFDFETQKIRVVEYRNRSFSKLETVERARRYLDAEISKTTKTTKNEQYKYNLFENNCEHFATYCCTGKRFSIQVRKFRLTAALFLKSGFLGISDELTRNEKEFENEIICRQCYDINKELLRMDIKPIKKAEDVKKGDIIRYTYWNLWHEAVVLEVTEERTSYTKCQIAHYAFCGFFSHRTIISEALKINFDGKCKKLDYKPPVYNVFDPDIVVERAKRRLGEQQFVFFSNDSSHFARWCKLKLQK